MNLRKIRDWLRYPRAFKAGWQQRQVVREQSERRAIFSNTGFQQGAGRVATYAHYLENNRDSVADVVFGPEDALAQIGQYNVGPAALTMPDLLDLINMPTKEPAWAVDRFPGTPAPNLAHMNLAMRLFIRYARSQWRLTAPDSVDAIQASQESYYQSRPTGDPCRLNPGESWKPGDPLRPFLVAELQSLLGRDIEDDDDD